MADTDTTLSAKQVASRIGTDAKTFRKWLRSGYSPYQAVGQGSRYEFPRGELGEIRELFRAWQAHRQSIANGSKKSPSN